MSERLTITILFSWMEKKSFASTNLLTGKSRQSLLVIHKVSRELCEFALAACEAVALKRGQAPRSTNYSNAVGTALQGEPALPKRI